MPKFEVVPYVRVDVEEPMLFDTLEEAQSEADNAPDGNGQTIFKIEEVDG